MASLVPSTAGWQDLKDHLKQCGSVSFCNIKKNAGVPGAGEVRFESAEQAQAALSMSGTFLGEYMIDIRLHPGSKDGTKLAISNLPPGFEWQELKDFFATAGLRPSFCNTTSGGTENTAEVRFGSPELAQTAVQLLNGSVVGGGVLNIEL